MLLASINSIFFKANTPNFKVIFIGNYMVPRIEEPKEFAHTIQYMFIRRFNQFHSAIIPIWNGSKQGGKVCIGRIQQSEEKSIKIDAKLQTT